MSISDKIEEIRRKPEHIRMRYVLGGVAVSMFFIVIIWLFSLSETMKKSSVKSPAADPLNLQFEQGLERLPSIEDFMEQLPADTQTETEQPAATEVPEATQDGSSQILPQENISQ